MTMEIFMAMSFEPVEDGEGDDDTCVRIMVNGQSRGMVWCDRSRVFDLRGRPTPRFNRRWFGRREGADEDDIVGKGEARATTRKGDGFFDRAAAVRAVLDAQPRPVGE